MASLETTRGRQVPAWQQANRYYQEPTNYVVEMQPRSQSTTAPATRRRRKTSGDYTIQKGDTLSAIAKRYGTTVQAIAQANGIADVNKIYVGDSLNIPGNTTARTINTSAQKNQTNSTQINQNMRARQSRLDTAIAVSKVPSRLSVNNSTEPTSTYNYSPQRHIDLFQASAKVPSRLATDNIRITPKQNKQKSLRTTKTRNTKTRRTNTANSYPNNQYPIFKIFS